MTKKLLLCSGVSCVLALACACGGPKGRGPDAPRTNVGRANTHDISNADEQILERATQMKNAGDNAGAFRLVETLPVDSPARLDKRYDAIQIAWSDERTRQIGRDIVHDTNLAPLAGGGQGGGPPALQTDEPSKTALDAATFERVIEAKRVPLRGTCYKDSSAPTSFVLGLHVDPDGTVTDVMVDNLVGDKTVAACAKSEARGWRFPQTQQGGDFTTRIYFRR